MQDAATDFINLTEKILAEDLELVISIAVIIVALVLVWLLLRGPRLWYWKVNQKAGTLKKIDSRLKHVENYLNDKTADNLIIQEKMEQVFTCKNHKPEGPGESENKALGAASANETVDEKHNAKFVSDLAEQELKKLAEGKAEQEAKELAEDKAEQEAKRLAEEKIETYVGKSGKIYREDELEALIKD